MGTSTVVVRAGLAGVIAAAGLLSAGPSLAAAQPSTDDGPVATSQPSARASTAHELMVLAGKLTVEGKRMVNLDGFQCPADHPYLMPGAYSELLVPRGVEVKVSGVGGRVQIHEEALTYQDGKPSGWIRDNEDNQLADAFAVNFDPEPVSISIIAHCQNIKPA